MIVIMKSETRTRNLQIANDAMYYIYTHIDLDISVEELARRAHVSRFHFQRLFKEVFGRNVHETIQSIRLEKAANLLVVNRHATISQVAKECGYTSQTSFIRLFKARFGMTPGKWRQGGYLRYGDALLAASGQKGEEEEFGHLEPAIVKRPDLPAYYIRHDGYDLSITRTWQKLQTFILSHGLEEAPAIGLYHDNPAIKPLASCQYVACVATNRLIAQTKLPRFTIAGGVYAAFDIEGDYERILRFIHWVYRRWIPQNGYETTPKPSYALYERNGFLSPDRYFKMRYYVSVRL
ncbi:AraC family transcriptional regulator [Hydrogenimonas sp.]